jgi:Mn2+/Fe2+ NRAMP family transporter
VAALAMGLLVANTITVGADLSAMADAAEMLSSLNSHYYVIFFGVIIALATVLFRYRQIVNLLKWFALSLFTYVLTAFVIQPNWNTVVRETLVPSWPTGHVVWAGLVAIFGATISPYVFFWQASLASEDNGDSNPIMPSEKQIENRKRIYAPNLGVAAGSLFSNLAMYFIILTAALTLHRNGITNIDTSRAAAAALVPLAGSFAATLFTVGIVGVGLVSIPILITSAAYSLAETFRWKAGLNETFGGARPFYSVILLSIVIGIALDFADVSPFKALYWAAIVNGVLAPFLLIGILIVASDRKIMRQQPSSFLSRLTIAATALVMLGAAVGMFVF